MIETRHMEITASGPTGKRINLSISRDATVRELISRALPDLPALKAGTDEATPVAFLDRTSRDLDPTETVGEAIQDRDHIRLIPPSIAGGC